MTSKDKLDHLFEADVEGLSETPVKEEKLIPETNKKTLFKRGIYSCHYCGLDVFSSNYQISYDEGFYSFSESLTEMNLYKAQIKENFYREVYCSACNSKLGYLFLDSNLTSRRRFFIPENSLIFRNQIFGMKQ